MLICQFLHTLSYGDAISNEALTIDAMLRNLGIESRIYGLHTHDKLREHFTHWEKASGDIKDREERGEPVGVLMHYSIGSPLTQVYAGEQFPKKFFLYHNMTPERFFSPYNARVAAALKQGRHDMQPLLDISDFVLADSHFNSSELLAMGVKSVGVLPLPLDAEKWRIAANVGIRRVLQATGGVNVLHVGRIAPNKCLEDIIKAFYFYHHKINQKSRLWLVGSDVDTEIYSFELRRLVSRLALKSAVNFVGSVSDCELKSFYENSHVYLCMSEHEGFCVPLIEAMHFGVPIVAYRAGAIPETLQDAGVIFDVKEHAAIAEALNILAPSGVCCSDSQGHSNLSAGNPIELHRDELIRRGKERVENFSLQAFSEQLIKLVVEPLRS